MWLTVIWLGQTEGPQAVAPGSYCRYWFFAILISLHVYLAQPNIVGRALNLPQSNVPYLLCGLDGGEVEECVMEMGGREGVETWIGIFY